MAEENKATETATTTETAPTIPEGAVSKAEFEKVMEDLHKFKKRSHDLEAKFKKEEEEQLRKTGEWQKIAELKTKEAEEKDERLNQIQRNLIEDKKFSAVKEAALKAGMTEQGIRDLELLNLKEVVVETTSTGRVNVLGADRFIETQKQIRPAWFAKPNINVNGKVPEVTNGSIANEQDLLKMSLEASKTGDYTTYEKALKDYQTRKRV